jgi:hypothetical protein
MQTALRLHTTVLPGRRIEVTDPELPEGSRVEVIILFPADTSAPPGRLRDARTWKPARSARAGAT